MGQQTTVTTKNADAALKDVVGSLSNTLNKFEETINKIINPPKAAESAPPALDAMPAIPTTPQKKSIFKTIDDELNKIWGY